MPVALPHYEDSFHCCMADGENIYESFLNSTSTCTHSILLHPVCTMLLLAFCADPTCCAFSVLSLQSAASAHGSPGSHSWLASCLMFGLHRLAAICLGLV